MPVKITAAVTEINKSVPNSGLLKAALPTTDNVKTGDGEEQRTAALTLSLSETRSLFLKSETIFAPTGYPEIRLIIKAYPHAPFTLNILLVMGDKNRDILPVIRKFDRIPVITRYGKSDGRTHVAQRHIPSKDVFAIVLSSEIINAVISNIARTKNSFVHDKKLFFLSIIHFIKT